MMDQIKEVLSQLMAAEEKGAHIFFTNEGLRFIATLPDSLLIHEEDEAAAM
jgi:hypothetical protein